MLHSDDPELLHVKWVGDHLVRFLDDGRHTTMLLAVDSTVIEADGHCWIRTKDGWAPGIPADSEVWCEHA